MLPKGAKGSTCPAVPGWKTQNLLDLAAAKAEEGIKCAPPVAPTRANLIRMEKLDGLFHKHGLDRFCFYTAEGGQRRELFPKTAGLVKVEPDRMGLTASAPPDLDPLGTQIWERLADQFVARVGTVRFNDFANPTVRLVFVDSQPTGEGVPAPSPAPVSWHGYGMAHLANEMVCGPAQSCPIHLATRLALRYDAYDTDPYSGDDPGNDAGGHQGRIGDLAAAIAAEVDHWQQHYADMKLILNLSIGWDGEYHELDPDKEDDLDLATQAVYAALKVAHDDGALVIAAAGNRTGGENSQQPLLPAAWELHPPAGAANLSGQKLAYAVGGVDWQDLPLPNARPFGMPQLVAYADHAVARTSDGSDGEPTKVYTGSSVAAVVASASAAVTWHLRPSWTPADVMGQLKQATVNLSSTATYYPSGGSAPFLQRLSLRQALSTLCGQDAGCPGVVAPSLVTESLMSSPADLSAITSQISSSVVLDPVDPPSTCDSQTQVYMASNSPSNLQFSDPRGCPMETLPDMNSPSLTQTQPPDTPCPTCSIGPGSSGGFVSAGAAPQRVASLNNPWLGLDPEVNASQSYSLAAAIDPDWLANQNGTTIDSAILVIDCKTEPQLKERLDLTTQFQALLSASQSGVNLPQPVQSISFGGVSGQRSIAGCTASVDFTLSVNDGHGNTSQRSVQSPVYVDP
ncbi:MAG TPA: S8 family serine peptidase [Thermoanaerobaculia bacterium]|nr:S8 family serine peptidase [Thermoanaerobaculia bacterium]